jgi:uncharacterized protein (TIGR00288 family)
MTSPEKSHRIAVFIDFDNVEIGVKSTIGGQFDIGLVLEAIKERGEIVTKIAYSDWKRAGDYSRLLTQHAIRMVQRNLTPGGDKNGADITMALDALEMAFTHDHINAFVIVGGDSDFISLVEKLKQYGRKVIVVGGRQFTSLTMQKNCHEFIAYENLVGSGSGSGSQRRHAERGGRPAAASAQVVQALPLVLRALKVLSEREVTPQLGLLKSTLLQLDSTFSEREYGAGSFRDFMEKVAQTGAVTLRSAGRSMLVEATDGASPLPEAPVELEPRPAPPAPPAVTTPAAVGKTVDTLDAPPPPVRPPQPAISPITGMLEDSDEEESLPQSPMTMQDGIRTVQQAFAQTQPPPRWPMYVRQAKQFLRVAIPGFDERNYGFASVVDLLRAAGKEGVLRIERDRQGAVRIFPGASLAQRPASSDAASPAAYSHDGAHDEPIEMVEQVMLDVPMASVVAEVTVDDNPVIDAVSESVADTPEAYPDHDVEPDEPGDVNGNRIDRVERHHVQPRRPSRSATRTRPVPSPVPAATSAPAPAHRAAPKAARSTKAAKPSTPARPKSRKSAKPKAS